jgi:hypothetical protein
MLPLKCPAREDFNGLTGKEAAGSTVAYLTRAAPAAVPLGPGHQLRALAWPGQPVRVTQGRSCGRMLIMRLADLDSATPVKGEA